MSPLVDDDDDDEEIVLPEDFPVLPDMRDRRNVDLAVNKHGYVWIVYDKPFEDRVNWIEYDDDLKTLTLVLHNGKMQDLGKKVPPKLQKNMRKAKLAMFALMNMKEKKIEKAFPATIVVRRTGV